MAWTQEEIRHVYGEVKSVVASIYASNPDLSAPEIRSAAKTKLKYRFGYRDYRGWRMHGYGTTDKKYKRFIKSKYHSIGLPSKEMQMLVKMINAVVDGLECNENSFAELNSAICKVDTAASKAKAINQECDGVVAELDKICKYLEDSECHEENA